MPSWLEILIGGVIGGALLVVLMRWTIHSSSNPKSRLPQAQDNPVMPRDSNNLWGDGIQ